MEMENLCPSRHHNLSIADDLSKKRPDSVRLDIEKMFQESVELTAVHRKLVLENKKLQKEFKKVEETRHEKQQFISNVQKIVKEKSKELAAKNSSQSSWLVFKLHKKISDLQQDISRKDEAITKLQLSKENQILYRKEVELECLQEITDFNNSHAKQSFKSKTTMSEDPDTISRVRDIIWMEDHLRNQEHRLQQLEVTQFLIQSQLEQEERETKKIISRIAEQKGKLREMKEISRKYQRAQEVYKSEKKKKEEKIVGNNCYLSELIKERDTETENLQKLRQKQKRIEQEENEEIDRLKAKLQHLQAHQQENTLQQEEHQEPIEKCKTERKKESWIRRVTYQEVRNLTRNINYTLRLNKVTQEQWVSIFFKDSAEEYSIQSIIDKLSEPPFCLSDHDQRKLIARYAVEDSDQGLLLQDLERSQAAAIVKSIMMQLLGDIKVHSEQAMARQTQRVGDLLSKFHSLVEQVVNLKEGNITHLTESQLTEAMRTAILDITPEEIEFVVLYLFSWSKDINNLDLKKLGKLKSLGFNPDP